ncbi:MAG: cation:proton antiporter [Rhodomicrobiaceae bacterium]|nr:MAG: cation:proton antiporter [Methyloligella sp.]
MSPQEFFELSIYISFGLSIVAFLFTIIRLILGTTLADRILSLDMLVTLGIGFIAIFTLHTGFYAYLDMAIALGLVGFLATVAFARLLMHRGETNDTPAGDKLEDIEDDDTQQAKTNGGAS